MSQKLAKNMYEQCTSFRKVKNDRMRCQLVQGHTGKHLTADGWQWTRLTLATRVKQRLTTGEKNLIKHLRKP